MQLINNFINFSLILMLQKYLLKISKIKYINYMNKIIFSLNKYAKQWEKP
jgi:hypothetical protein